MNNLSSNDKENKKYLWFRELLLKWFVMGTFIGMLISLVIAIISNSQYFLFALFSVIFSSFNLILLYFKKYNIVSSIILIEYSLFSGIYSSIVASAYTATSLGVILIVGGILIKGRYITLLFFLDLIYIVVMVFLGIFTFTQEIGPTGLTYVNSISTLIPILIVSYFISIVISKILIGTINTQREQYQFLKNTQEKLIEQEKLKTIQVISGGIAHDFNNLLTSIIGNLSLIEFYKEISTENMEFIKEALAASYKAGELAKKLMDFSKEGKIPSVKEIIDAEKFVEDIANFILSGRKSSVKIEADPKLAVIKVDPSQISQVIQNLIINADESMPKGGIITIKIKDIMIKSQSGLKLKEGKYRLISVQDMGVGIPKDIQKKIFEPFYTTKNTGTGLGLAICLSIIEKHNGLITLESEVGKGSTFNIYLPIEE